MKKLSLYTLLSMLCMFMASCDEDFEDWAEPQSWPQDEAVTVPGFTASATGSTINLKDVTTDSVKLFSIDNSAKAEIANVRVKLHAVEVNKEAFVETFDADTTGQVLKEDIAKFVEELFGKRPVERLFQAEVIADAMVNGQAMLVNAGVVTVKIVPEAPIIEQNYYLCGDMCGWDTNAALKFEHSDKDVYEDPVFTLVFDTSKDDTYWKVLIANADGVVGWDGQLGVAENGDASFTGRLVQKVGDMPDPGAGRIEKTGKYLMTLNMMDGTYEIKPLVSEFYYLVGALQGWNANADGMTCMFYPNSVTEMEYTTKWEGDGNFKFWTAGNFGNWDNAMGTEVDMSREMTGKIVTTGAGAIAVPEQNMFYTVKVNTAAMTYEWVKCDNQDPKAYDKIGLIGGFNGWGGDAELKQAAPHNWYGEISLTEDTELKFRANADWTDDWGIAEGEDSSNAAFHGAYKGGNIKMAAGDYKVFFNDITAQMIFLKK